MSDLNKALDEFLKDQFCLIVEPSPTFSASIMACLSGFGLRADRVKLAKTFEDAKRFIHESKPKILITEYEVGPHFGLALIEAQESHYGEMERISIIVTKNSSDSAVSEAAEEQVDAFILKPFSSDVFSDRVREAFQRKIKPTEYVQSIREGKKDFDAKEFEAAHRDFEAAKGLHQKPALACFYLGQTLQAQGDTASALQEFREGLKHNPLHYKCLIGQFEILMAEKNYAEAYKLVATIKANYPLTSHRLGQIFIAAVYTRHFDDLQGYFDLFTRLDQRTPWLIQLTSLALFTAAKFQIVAGDMTRAMRFFDMALTAAAREIKFVEMIVDELVTARAGDQVQQIVAKILPTDIGTPAHARISLKADMLTLGPDQVIEKGRRLVSEGHGSPEMYPELIRIMVAGGKDALAETVVTKALEKNPELRVPLYKVLDEARAAFEAVKAKSAKRTPVS